MRFYLVSLSFFTILCVHCDGLLRFNKIIATVAVASLSHVAPTIAMDDLPFQSVAVSTVTDYNRFSSDYDKLDGGQVAQILGINGMRAKAASFVSGEVVELAVGTALQSEFYDWRRISSYTGVDYSEGMLSEADERLSNLAQKSNKSPVKLIKADAAATGLSSGQYDSVVDTFSMCVFKDPAAVVTEMKHLVKPSTGRIVLLENTRSTSPVLGWVQDITEPLITPMSKGCRWNVDVPRIAAEAGLKLEYSENVQKGTISLSVYSRPSVY